MKWPWGSPFTIEQRKETARVLLNVCHVIALGLIASPFIPGLAKRLALEDTIYGIFLVLFLYLLAMRLLKEKI